MFYYIQNSINFEVKNLLRLFSKTMSIFGSKYDIVRQRGLGGTLRISFSEAIYEICMLIEHG